MSLTCHTAGELAQKELPAKFTRLELDLIRGFTPRRSADKASWSAELMNYYFSLGMVRLNPAIAVCLMAEAGVADDSIEYALVRAKVARKGDDFKLENTSVAIAPPTFSDDVEAWLDRGYEVQSDLKLGDVCVYEGLVGFVHKVSDDGLVTMAGFYPGSGGKAIPEERLIKVVRV